jgi:cell division protein FtsB
MQTPSVDQSPSPSRAQRPRRFPLSNLQIILMVLIVIGGRLAIDFSQRIIEGQQKIGEQQELEAEIAGLQAEQRALEADKAFYSSPDYIETWAHDEGKMVRDGERLIVPVYEDIPEVAEGTDNPTATSAPIPTWQVWWTLFFDAPPPALIASGF